jgi:hypothetical protein
LLTNSCHKRYGIHQFGCIQTNKQLFYNQSLYDRGFVYFFESHANANKVMTVTSLKHGRYITMTIANKAVKQIMIS